MKRFFTGTAVFALLAGLMLYGYGCGGGAGINSVVTGTSASSSSAGTFTSESPEEITAYTAAAIGEDAAQVTTFTDGTATTAAAFLDMATCNTCHATTYTGFLQTNHNLAWNKKAVQTNSAYSNKSIFGYYKDSYGYTYCVNCHSVNAPFQDANENHTYDAGELVPFGLAAPASYADYSVVPAEYQGIQCENCHGPASLHAAGDQGKIVGATLAARATTCMYCHVATYEEWTKAKHSTAASEDPTVLTHGVSHPLHGFEYSRQNGNCAGCHSGDGFISALDDAQEPVEYCASGNQGANKATNCVAYNATTGAGNGHNTVTCATCHDLHGTGKGEHQLRVAKEDLCGKCHMNRYRKYVSASGSTSGSTVYDKVPGASRGPHLAGQLEMALGGSGGNGAVQPATGTPVAYSYGYSTNRTDTFVKYSFINTGPAMGATTCVDCHMYSKTDRAAGIEWTGHTFNARTEACQSCHSGMNAGSVIAAKQARFTEKEEALTARYKSMLTGLGALGTSSSCPEASDQMCCNAIATGSATRDYCALIEYNIVILEIDMSKGVHNEAYVNAIYTATDAMLTSLGY